MSKTGSSQSSLVSVLTTVCPAVVCVGLVLLAHCSSPLKGKNSHTGGSGGASGLPGTGGVVGSGGRPDAGPDVEASMCQELAQAAQTDFDAKLAGGLSGTCQTDSDCTRFQRQDLNCVAPCGAIVALNGVAAVTAAAPTVCAQYVAAGCPEIKLLCVGTTIICDSGQCRYDTPRITDAAPDLLSEDATAGGDEATDGGATRACMPPVEGAACTAEQTPCATCCTDHWSCAAGVWTNQFLGCLPTQFSCGDQACNEGQSYCDVVYRGGELPMPILYTCQLLPGACDQRCPTCACLKQAGLTFFACTDDVVGAITVSHF